MIIGLLAALNGALVQIIMGSRVLYGLAGNGQAPTVFARVNRRTKTPLESTAVVTVIVLLLWLFLTSLVMLIGDQLNVIVGELMIHSPRLPLRRQQYPPQTDYRTSGHAPSLDRSTINKDRHR